MVSEDTRSQKFQKIYKEKPITDVLQTKVRSKIKNIVARYSAELYQSRQDTEKEQWKTLKEIHISLKKKHNKEDSVTGTECLKKIKQAHSELYQRIKFVFKTVPGSREKALSTNLLMNAFFNGVSKIITCKHKANEKYSLFTDSESSDAENALSNESGEEPNCAFPFESSDSDDNKLIRQPSTDESSEECEKLKYTNAWSKRFGVILRKRCNQASIVFSDYERQTIQDLIPLLETLALEIEKKQARNLRNLFWNTCCDKGMPSPLIEIIKSFTCANMSLADEVEALKVWLQGDDV